MKTKKGLSNMLKGVVELSLKTNANSTTCYSIYQPKAPASLKKYSKENDK